MTAKHPFPQHVVEAVALSILEVEDGWCEFEALTPASRKTYFDQASTHLQALWEASRVDDLEAMKTLPHDAVVRSDIGGEPYTPYNFIHAPYEEDYPAHVIYWGEPDA